LESDPKPSDPSPVSGTLVDDGRSVEDAGRVDNHLYGPGDQPGALSRFGAGQADSLQRRPDPGTGLRAKHQALIAKADEKIRRKATDIVVAALSAPELAEIPPEAVAAALQAGTSTVPGWTKKKLRIALDASNSMKSAPAYLAMAQRVVESYKKAEADKPAAPTINAEVVQVHVSVANYPRRRLSEE
jgi:hypothetical protein